MLVKEVMKVPVVIEKDVTLKEAAEALAKRKIGSLIYLVDGRVEGIITERDLIKHFGEKKKVTDVMSRNVVTVNPNEEIEIAFDIMKAEKIKRLPVTYEGKLVGMVNFIDLLGMLSSSDEKFFFD